MSSLALATKLTNDLNLTLELFNSLMSWMDNAGEESKDFSDGAWWAYLEECSDRWCKSYMEENGGIMVLDSNNVVQAWLSFNNEGKSND